MSEPTSSLVTSPVMLLIGLGRIAHARLDQELAAEGLSLRHLGALGHLRHTPGLSYSELGRRAGVTAQSMQATVGQLEQLGAVARGGGGRGRSADLQVTPAGVAALDRAERVIAAIDIDLFGGLPKVERTALADGLSAAMRLAWPR